MKPEDQEGLSPQEKGFLQAVEDFVTRAINGKPEWKPVAERFEVSLGYIHDHARIEHDKECMVILPGDARGKGQETFLTRVLPTAAAHDMTAKAAAARGGADPCIYWCYVGGILKCCGVSP